VDRTGVAGKAALKPESAATYGVGAGVGVVAEFDDVLPQALNPMATAIAPPASRIDTSTRISLVEAIRFYGRPSTAPAMPDQRSWRIAMAGVGIELIRSDQQD